MLIGHLITVHLCQVERTLDRLKSLIIQHGVAMSGDGGMLLYEIIIIGL